ncbi:MAG: porin family protein [Proteobacteria bacterium]|nr:porin family protein [Pseudomonadota bacterium]
MKIRKLLMISTTVAALTGASTVSADAASTYASIFGGASFLGQPHISGSSFTHYSTRYYMYSKQSVDTSFKTGFVVGGNYGIDWGNFRTELELAYRESTSGKHGVVKTSYELDLRHYPTTSGTISFNPYTTSKSTRTVPTAIRLSAYSLMANVWYDFHNFEASTGLTPYIGGGIGMAQVKIAGSIDNSRLFEKNDQVFAWQVGAGVSMPVWSGTSLFLDYRYFSADSAHLYIEPGYHGGDVNADFDSHNVLVGLRFAL